MFGPSALTGTYYGLCWLPAVHPTTSRPW